MAAETMQVTCPPGAKHGTKVPVQTPDGRLFQVAVPRGVKSGQTFVIKVPAVPVVQAIPVTNANGPTATAVPVTAEAQPAAARVVETRYSGYYPSAYGSYEDRETCCGCGNACGLIVLAILTLAFSLSLTQHVTYYYSLEDTECYYEYRCCNYYCTYLCPVYVCDGDWRSTHPIVQDELPAPEQVGSESVEVGSGNETLPVFKSDGGDGTLDYWYWTIPRIERTL